MAQLLVPEGVYLVCTDGMTTNQLQVTSQSSVLMYGGHSVATMHDRMTANFNCAKMVLAGAIIGAIIGAIAAAAIVLSGGTALVAAATAAAATVGYAGTGLLAGMIPCICAMLTSDWTPFHPMIIINKVHMPILETSKMTCCLGGTVEICYSKEKAEALQDYKRWSTGLSVAALAAASAAVGSAIGGLLSSVGSLATTFTEFGVQALGKQLLGMASGFAMNAVSGFVYDKVKENTSFNDQEVNDIIDGTAFGDGVSQSDFNKYSDIAQNPLGSGEGSETVSRIPDASTTANAQTGIYSNVGSIDFTNYRVVYVASPDGTITPTPTVDIHNTTVLRNTVGNGNVSRTQHQTTHTSTNSYRDRNGNYHVVVEGEVNGVMRNWNLGKTLLANAKEAGKGIVINLLTDVLRASGNYLLASKIEAKNAAEKNEEEEKAKINVYENKI